MKRLICLVSAWVIGGLLCAGVSAEETASQSSTLIIHCGTSSAAAPAQAPLRAAAPTPIATPEPSTVALLGLGLAGLAGFAARKRARAIPPRV